MSISGLLCPGLGCFSLYSPNKSRNCVPEKISQRKMTAGNHSTVMEFILAGLTDKPELQLPLFLFFLGVYVVTVVGNLGIITLIVLSSHLHTPMYYFLSSLSFIDLCYSTVITPKMLVNFVTEKNTIFYPECMTQLYFFIFFIVSEGHMLAVMAYDRYVAICNPLLYNVTMSYQVCSWLVVEVYMMGLIGATAYTGCMLRVIFCKAKIISHYFCDVFPLLELSCSSTYLHVVVLLCFSAFNILAPTLTILGSYVSIVVSIMQIRSTEGRSKAFSTCSSHVLAVTVFYGSAAFMYLHPSNVSSMDQSKVSSVFYTIIVPMLNPLIYSLRNKDVKVALNKIIEKRLFCINKDL
ncbi:olfactory receptor 150-like isoform X2 [Elephas maximus indicus]|uniref:olfactory receptor 150-like isoform X2 n=1 Tax=Elephas maximus indicus TaxID=99487 RepID=UPI002115FF0D|nr:olfactory receptor 150-like isoform X2 [Elephas maximus indicus]